MRVSVAYRSDVGRVRSGNEDSYLVDAPLFVIADGMGGHIAGEVASETAVETLRQLPHGPREASVDDLERYVKEANRAIWQKAQSDPKLQGMGTTCTLLYLEDSTAHFAHVGDSRAYILRSGELSQITEDHTLVERMVKEGRIRAEEAPHHPQRNIITRGLGIDSDVEVDVTSIEVTEGDRVLLCSDGLSSMIDHDRIRGILTEVVDPDEAAAALVDDANEAGGEDNITVLLLDFGPGDAGTEIASGSAAQDDAREFTDRDDPADSTQAVSIQQAPQRHWKRKLVIGSFVVILLLVGGYMAVQYSLDHSWFVGANDAGVVTIYSGIPDEVAGVSLREELQETDVLVADLPESHQERVESGIKATSLEDAEEKVDNLARLTEELGSKRPGAGN